MLYKLLTMILLTMLILTANVFAQDIEEEADTILPGDTVYTGLTDSASNNSIVIDGIRFRFCSDLKVFNVQNRLIVHDSLKEVVEAKLFNNTGCARKIKVLRFAE
ncbi:MAG: hypothetical protein ISR96_10390 [Nitrospira sp.]|nr:hypothetical protein [bacterium]MBL7049910.1 hypothetical protein [Nitrospira sp.]